MWFISLNLLLCLHLEISSFVWSGRSFRWCSVVSISLCKFTFADSVVYFSMIISKIWSNYYFVYCVRKLALVRKGAIRFIYTVTVYCLYFLFCDYFFIIYIDNGFNICYAATTYFHIIFVKYLFIFILYYLYYLYYIYFLFSFSLVIPILTATGLECGFTLKHIRDMIRTYSHTHTDSWYFDSVWMLHGKSQDCWKG